jgi:hypothetical protein
MSRFKDFGAGGEVNKEPMSFKLHEEEFHCVPSIQGKAILELVSDSSSEDPSKTAGVIKAFFKQTLVDESYARFDSLLDDPSKIVTVEALGEISAWLVGEYTSRPTQRPEDSLSGQ